MSGNGKCRDRVLEALQAGKLPNRSPERTWGGLGSGACCVLCGERVGPDEMELELEFASDEGGKRDSYYVHVSCFSAWNVERHNLELQRDTIAVTELSRAEGESTLAAGEREAFLKQGPA